MAKKACKKKGNRKEYHGKGKPDYSCSKCGLKAPHEKHLCKPVSHGI